MTRRGRAMAEALVVQDRQEAREAKVLGLRYPCCDVACRHDLDLDEERQVACSRCGRLWFVRLVPGSERGAEMAGRPLAKAQWRRREVVKTDEAGAVNADLVKERGALSTADGV